MYLCIHLYMYVCSVWLHRCINGVLKNKPRILVTHQLQYLQAADKILVLKEVSVPYMYLYCTNCLLNIDFTDCFEHFLYRLAAVVTFLVSVCDVRAAVSAWAHSSSSHVVASTSRHY